MFQQRLIFRLGLLSYPVNCIESDLLWHLKTHICSYLSAVQPCLMFASPYSLTLLFTIEYTYRVPRIVSRYGCAVMSHYKEEFIALSSGEQHYLFVFILRSQ